MSQSLATPGAESALLIPGGLACKSTWLRRNCNDEWSSRTRPGAWDIKARASALYGDRRCGPRSSTAALLSRNVNSGVARSVTAASIKNTRGVWTNIAIPATLDPAIGFDSDTLQMVRNVYEGLLEYVPGGTTVRPALATSYNSSADGLTWTFQIRKGVVFHDGTPLDAAAVVKSLHRIQSINQGPASLLANVKGFQAAGPSTVVVHMSSPYVFLPGVMPWLPIVSPAALAAPRHPPTHGPRNGSPATRPELVRTY